MVNYQWLMINGMEHVSHDYEYRIECSPKQYSISYRVYKDERYMYGIDMPYDVASAMMHTEPCSRFEQAMLGLEEGDSREDVCCKLGQFGRFLRKAWRELAGEEVEFPTELFDVGLEDFFLYGEAAAVMEVVCRRKDRDGCTTAKARTLDEAKLVKLVDDEAKQERLAVEGVGHRLVVKIECTSVETGNQFNKHLVFELRGDGVGHDEE